MSVTLSERTLAEMSRGREAAAATDAFDKGDLELVRRLGIVGDGRRALNKLYMANGLGFHAVHCHYSRPENVVEVSVDGLVWVEPLEGFPSPELKAKIMLIAP